MDGLTASSGGMDSLKGTDACRGGRMDSLKETDVRSGEQTDSLKGHRGGQTQIDRQTDACCGGWTDMRCGSKIVPTSGVNV